MELFFSSNHAQLNSIFDNNKGSINISSPHRFQDRIPNHLDLHLKPTSAPPPPKPWTYFECSCELLLLLPMVALQLGGQNPGVLVLCYFFKRSFTTVLAALKILAIAAGTQR
jgi:hypothetical protein